MATLVLGVAGAAIGSAIGGTIFGMSMTSFGWNVGTLIGGYLFAPKQPTQYGPRLGDLKVQVSTYGNPIPIVYGNVRVAGNCIWSTPKLETSHSQTTGGKGGGGVTQVSYTYSQSFAIAVCEGEISGIRKIWANGKLIYNVSDTADIATIIASNKSAAGIRIYTGSETQTADSLIQANVGAADTPAYRGTAYVVFENLQLADYGNSMPNLEFEVIKSGSNNYVSYTLPTVPNFPGTGNVDWNISIPAIGGLNDPIEIYVGQWDSNYIGHSVKIYQIENGTSFLKGTLTADSNQPFAKGVADSAGFLNLLTGFSPYIYTWQSLTGSSFTYEIPEAFGGEQTSFAKESGQIYLSSTMLGSKKIYARGTLFAESLPLSNYCTICIDSIYIYCLELASPAKLTRLLRLDLSIVDTTILDFNAINQYTTKIRISPDGNIYVLVNGNLRLITGNTSSVIATGLTSGNSPWISIDSDGSIIFSNFPDPVSGRFCATKILTKALSVSAIMLSSIVSDICARAGLSAGDIDVTALTDTVNGYVVQRGTARSWIEPLMQAFYFDAVESDGKIKFVKRGGVAAVAIPEDDLAAHEYGSQVPDNLISNRKQEMELPVEVDVQYMDTSGAYQIGTQQSRRLTTDSENKISVNLAIAMPGSKAKQISDVLMYEAWTSRMVFDFQNSWKYAWLEPSDVLTVTKGALTYTLRIVDEDADRGIYKRRAVLEDASIYNQNAIAAPIVVADDTVSSVPLTDLMLMDIPLLRDQDDGVGFYAAACGYVDGWIGAQTFKSNDGGTTWNSYGQGFLNEASIGMAMTVLGDFHSGNIFDELNSVSVEMVNGMLASDTELNILNGANIALLGDEIIQFKNAVLTASNTYTLTGLLRGRRGTEFGMSTHASGERFVLLTTTTTYLLSGSSTEYDLLRYYRGVSFGGFLDDAPTINFTNTAASLMPYAPVQLGGGRNAALDIVLTWVRRTRLGGAWNSYSDVPLGEASEAYEVEIWNSGYTVLKRTITGISTQTTTYTAAQQTTDFGGTQATVYFKVFQLSAVVGRGFEARGTV